MAELNLYDVDFGDFPTQIKLSDEDAKAYGDRASKVGSVDVRRAIKTHHGIQIEGSDPYASSGEVPDEDSDKNRKAVDDPDQKKAPAPANKSRSAASKS